MKNFIFLFLIFSSTFLHAKELVIVTDLDETLRKANVENTPAAIFNIMKGVKPYEGMRKIFIELKHDNPNAKFYYLSNSMKFYYSGNRWADKFGFPDGIVFQRRLFKDKSKTFKPKKLREIVAAHPDAKFMLFGDNVERDPLFYRDLVTETKIDAEVYIRDALLIFPMETDITFYQHEAQITKDLDISADYSERIRKLGINELVPKFLFKNLKKRVFEECADTEVRCRRLSEDYAVIVKQRLINEL